MSYTVFLKTGFLFLVLLCLAGPVSAQVAETAAAPTPPIDVMPAETAFKKGLINEASEITHPEIRMTPDKSDIVYLEKPASSIIIGNQNHLAIMADSAQTLVLIPKAPGATYFTVLDRTGNVIMQRHVLVDAPEKKYMRVRRSCASSGDKNCQETSVFYCPDMCHKIILNDGASGNTATGTGTTPESVTQNTQDMNNATGTSDEPTQP